MAISNFIPELWTSETLDILKNKLVGEVVCNRQFEEDVMNEGDTVHILKSSALTDAAYPATSNITYEAPADAVSDLLIDINRYAAFTAEDIDKVQSKPEWVAQYTRQMAYQISDYFDAQIMAEYANASLDSYETGTTAWQFAAAGTDVPYFFASIKRQLEVANAPDGQPFVIGPPQLGEALNRYFGAKATGLGDNVSLNGFAGQVMGVNVYTSNNAGNSGQDGIAGIEGQTIALAYQIKSMEALRLEGRVADGVRALYVGGIKTYRPENLIDCHFNSTLIGS
jgi:hypothetical protein